ncbi:unnamed protein product [Paramecium octaurelia]|uniref:PPM-type phosphatase domain-containing protein n=1 Tax=Paramecium octaurelia TaxID=43137 RepID=A0A8S1SKR1_PAROT|nr:unnamed protein product [Paramecium octaurelia]
MNQKLDILKQVKIPRSISTTNQKATMKKLNNQSMQTIVDKLPPIHPEPLQRIQTELQEEHQCVKYITAKTLAGQTNRKRLKINQDSLIIKKYLCNQIDWHLFGVFDGHGQNGHFISKLISQLMPKVLENKLLENRTSNANDIKQILINTFQHIENELVDNSNIACNFSGSTAIVTYFMGSKIFCANVGDSRAVFFYRSGDAWFNRALSFDHKPNKSIELKRILGQGGRVEQSFFDGKRQGAYRVWLPHEDVPGLAMSRSIGDLVAKQVGVIAEPEILRYKIPNNGFVLIGSDGLWDKMDYESIQKILHNYYPPLNQIDVESAIQRLLGETYTKWDQLDAARDDITIILIYVET